MNNKVPAYNIKQIDVYLLRLYVSEINKGSNSNITEVLISYPQIYS